MRPWWRTPRPSTVLVTLTALVAGLLFATSASTAQGTDLRSDRRLRLTELIEREAAAAERTERTAAGLRQEVRERSARAAAGDGRVAAAQPSRELEVAAGLVAASGPGVTVSLDDAPRRTGRPELSSDPDDLVVHQQDLQAVVNALWAGGAEALTLMGQRIVSTSAVRCVGNTVILHGQVYSPPFVVAAIGSPAQLREALERSPGVAFFQTFVDRFGLGYTVQSEGELDLPGYDGALALPHVQEPA